VKLPEFWKTGVAVLLLAGLVSYYWFVERKREPVPEGARQKVTMLTVDMAKAKEIEVATAGGEAIRVVKEANGWTVVSPFHAPADTAAVDSMLTSLGKLEADEVVDEKPTDIEQYGLGSPNRTVTARVEGASDPFSVQFGGKSPDGASVYARIPGSPKVYLVASWVEGSFDKKAFDLRDRDLLHIKREDVRSLEVTGADGGYSLARTDSGDWAFTKPIATRAGRWTVDSLLGTIENLRMDSVAAEDVKDPKTIARFGLDRATHSVSLVMKDGATRSLQIGAGIVEPAAGPGTSPSPTTGKPKPTKYYARQAGSGLVAVVPATLAEELDKGMGELRAKRLLEIATYETESFEVVEGGVRKSYTKTTTKGDDGLDKTQWKRTAPDQKDLDTTKVEDALFKMGSVEAASFVDQPEDLVAYGLAAPALKVTVRAKGESWVEIGTKDDAYYARRNNDAAILNLDAAKAQELVKAFTEL